MTGASVTNKGEAFLRISFDRELMTRSGIYYEPGKEPPPDGPPKLHLLIESNEEFRVRRLVTDTCTFLHKYLLYMTGGERSTRNQTAAHRSVDSCAPSRDAQSHCADRALQRRVNSTYFRIIVPCTTFYCVNLLLRKV